jgi:hypothetical protein
MSPVTISVNVSATANLVLNNAPTVTGHGGNVWVDSTTDAISIGVPASGDVGGTVPATLALTLGAPASFAPFTPGLATLTVSDPSGDHPGHLVNGAFFLPQPLLAGGSPLPAVVKAYSAPASNDAVVVGFTQPIAATDALRTGAYAKTLTFTLSTTNP